jgi:hypothetical protein
MENPSLVFSHFFCVLCCLGLSEREDFSIVVDFFFDKVSLGETVFFFEGVGVLFWSFMGFLMFYGLFWYLLVFFGIFMVFFGLF